jgi:hypothetical protein
MSLGLSKDSDDEMIYTALATKISSHGFSQYNLRDLSIRNPGDYWKIENQSNGNLLPSLMQTGASYYDTSLFFNPPLWPTVITASHKLFDSDKDFFLVLRRGLPWKLYREALYSSVPNAILGVLFLMGVFALARQFLENESHCYLATLFCLVSPVFLVCTFKVWSDLLAATLILWSFLFYRKNGHVLMVLFSGLLFGLAVLTRTTSWLAIAIFIQRDWRKALLFLLSALLVSSPWYLAMYRVYGNPFFYPQMDSHLKSSMAWFNDLSRQWYKFVFDLMYLSPLFILTFGSLKKRNAVLWIWACSFIIVLSFLMFTNRPIAVEDRYLLPAYPALAVLGAQAYLSIRAKIGKGFAGVILICCIVWSLRAASILIIARESLDLLRF